MASRAGRHCSFFLTRRLRQPHFRAAIAAMRAERKSLRFAPVFLLTPVDEPAKDAAMASTVGRG
ncbi:hypothetical protein ATY78_14955 [Rhizobium sp. R635]|nr:hypothetical protein ATY78_14955 [Rhizobium sp. R635]